MRKKEIRETVTELISDNEIEEALIFLKNKLKNNRDIVLLSSRYNALKKKQRRGTLSSNELNAELARISEAILEYIEPTYKIVFYRVKYLISTAIAFIGTLIFALAFVASIILGVYFLVTNIDSCNLPSFGSDNYINQIEKQNDIDIVKIKKAERITSYEFFSYDNDNNRVDWIMYIVNHGYWQKNEVAESVNNGQRFDICDYMSETKIADRINNDKLIGIICFGNASKEEEISLESEEERALIRAEKLSACIEPLIYTETPVYTLNLGKYLKSDILSKDQRKILVIGIKDKALQANEEDALYNGLVEKRKSIGFDVRNYSLGKDGKIRINKKIN